MRGGRGRLRRRLPAFLIVALTLRDMRGAGVGSRTGFPLRPAPRVWRVISQAPSGIRVGGAVAAPVIGTPLFPARPGG